MILGTDKILENCQVDLCHETNAWMSSTAAASDARKGVQNEDQQYKICQLKKLETVEGEYRNLDYCVATRASGEMGQMLAAITTLNTVNGELAAGFGELSAKLKETKDLMNNVLDTACRLERCIEDEENCNPGLYDALEEAIVTINQDGNIADIPFFDELNEMDELAQTGYDNIRMTFLSSAEIVGMLTFIDINNLDALAQETDKHTKSFKADVDDNLKRLQKDIDEANKAFYSIIGEVTTKQYELCHNVVNLGGVDTTRTWLCDDNCGDRTISDLQDGIEDLCEGLSDICALSGEQIADADLPTLLDCDSEESRCEDIDLPDILGNNGKRQGPGKSTDPDTDDLDKGEDC